MPNILIPFRPIDKSYLEILTQYDAILDERTPIEIYRNEYMCVIAAKHYSLNYGDPFLTRYFIEGELNRNSYPSRTLRRFLYCRTVLISLGSM